MNQWILGGVLIAAGALSIADRSSALAAVDENVIPASVLEQIREISVHPVTVLTLRAQNIRHADLYQEDIDRLDQIWRKETKADEQPLIAQLLGRPLSAHLTRVMARSVGLFSEIFVADAKGLNAGQSSITTDYWQGDEAKWLKTYAVGPDAVFLDDEEINESTGQRRRQLNLTIVDPDSGRPIGALTAELNMEELERRQGRK